jgi:hypothetical protein
MQAGEVHSDPSFDASPTGSVMVDQEFSAEDLISGSAGPFKWILVVIPLILCGFIVAAAVQTYLLPVATDRTKQLAVFAAMFVIFGGTSTFIWRRLMDQAYAQVGFLSLRKGQRLTKVPYSDIARMGVFRGRYGPFAWVRVRNPSGRGRLVFFSVRDDYESSWPSRTATRFLWKKLNDSLDKD